ncbi:MAG: transporter permease [Candidatus Saccharibacteria bacterium]|nr:transporter permease [Candidatus Saccharibacteria bacterium]
MRGALRSPVRSGAIIAMLAISIGLILAMLVARASVNAKISEVKATTATALTINPAGIQGGMGGGDPLTADQVKTIRNTAHISSVSAILTDQLGTTDTNLTPSFELGSFGKRMMRFDSGSSTGPSTNISGNADGNTEAKTPPAPRTSVTGTTNPSSITPSDKLTSGAMIDGNSSDKVALIGKSLADKNSLSVGSTFTAYGQTITVKGIFSVDNAFENNGIIVPLATLQTLTAQPGAVTNIAATVDSSDNVSSTVASLKKSLGDKADVTSQEEEAASSLAPLESIAGLALAGVIGASIAGATIVLLAMIMVVRERRREIGVIKAIGGSNAKVISQFMTEGMTLTVIGGIIGIVLGIAVSGPMTQSLVSSSKDGAPTNGQQGGPTSGSNKPAVFLRSARTQLTTNVNNVTSTLTPQTVVISIGIVALIAIIGSAVPAWAIARVRPAEVLRTE